MEISPLTDNSSRQTIHLHTLIKHFSKYIENNTKQDIDITILSNCFAADFNVNYNHYNTSFKQ